MKQLEKCIERLFCEHTVRNVAVRVGKGEHTLYETYRSAEGKIDGNTLFDMASVSKILCTTSLALMALEEGRIGLHEHVRRKTAEC